MAGNLSSKPIISFLNTYIFQPKANKSPPALIEKLRLRLQEYDFDVVYRPGSQNLADSLSNATAATTKSRQLCRTICLPAYPAHVTKSYRHGGNPISFNK